MSQILVAGQKVLLPVEVAKTWRGRLVRDGEIYVGRPSKWGNPYVIGKDGTREEVVQKYYFWLHNQPELLAELPSLKGKRLLCWCHPQLCHAHIIGLTMLQRGIN